MARNEKKVACPLYHVGDFERLRARWEPLQWNPYHDIDYLIWKFGRARSLEEPHILLLNSGQQRPFIVAGEIRPRAVQFQMGYKRWQGPVLRTLVVHKNALLGEASERVWELLEKYLVNMLLKAQVEAVLLSGFDPSGPVGRLSFSELPLLCKLRTHIVQEDWFVEKRTGLAAHRARHKNFWQNVRRRRNRLLERFGERLAVKLYSEIGDLDDLLNQTEKVARTTWQRRLGGQVFTSQEVRARYAYLTERGLLKGYVLCLDGRPAAFFHGIDYKGDFFVETLGYDPKYSELGVGTYLTGVVLEGLLQKDPEGRIHFGVGNSEAKSRFCDGFSQAADIFLVAPSPRLMGLNALRVIFLKVHISLKKALYKVGFYHKVRSAWRHGRVMAVK